MASNHSQARNILLYYKALLYVYVLGQSLSNYYLLQGEQCAQCNVTFGCPAHSSTALCAVKNDPDTTPQFYGHIWNGTYQKCE